MADVNPIGLTVQKVVEPGTDQGLTGEKPSPTAEVVSGSRVPSTHGTSRDHDPQYPPPTDEERSTLRKVPDSIAATAYWLCLVELAERASYYGVNGIFNNYLQFPLPKDGPGTGAINKNRPNDHAGALNMGVQTASALVLVFKFLAYVIPILGAWIADTKLGRYKTIVWGTIIGGIAHVIMVGGAAPSILTAGHGVAPFLISFFLLAFGAGIFKPNVAPTVIDQYIHQREYTKTLKTGEKVLVDPETTIQRIMLIFYSFINVGAFFSIATTYTEKYVGFWVAYLLPTAVYLALPVMLAALYKRTIRKPPQGSQMTEFFKITGLALKKSKGNVFSKTFWQKVRPSVLAEQGVQVGWSERMVKDVERSWGAGLIFLYFPIYNLNDGGVGNLLSNQGASMTTNGAPNDLLNNFNPLTIIAFAPFMSYVGYPLLARYNIRFGRINRMTFGFLLAAISGVIGAVVQDRVYKTSPCGFNASTCDGVSPISIWWQLPNVMLGAISEVFCMVTSYEMAYARAPPSMKATVMAMNLFMIGLSNALALILVPAITDPTLVWAWLAPAIALFVQTAIFWFRHRGINEDEFMTHDSDDDEPQEPVHSEKSKEEI